MIAQYTLEQAQRNPGVRGEPPEAGERRFNAAVARASADKGVSTTIIPAYDMSERKEVAAIRRAIQALIRKT